MIKFRLEIAGRYLDDAIELYRQNRYCSAVSRAYYASYQTMWSALGDPEEGKIWRHLAIIKHFVRGYWFNPDHSKLGPGLFEDKRLPLRRLYSFRIKSDYDGMPVNGQDVDRSIQVVRDLINIVKEKSI